MQARLLLLMILREKMEVGIGIRWINQTKNSLISI